jgi:iron complex outermembrane receptor protein
MSNPLRTTTSLLALMAAFPALAQQSTPLPPVDVQTSEGAQSLSGSSLSSSDLVSRRAGSDTAGLLDGLPGIWIGTGGPASGLPSIRGLGDDRVLQLIDGIQTSSACPNHMNPPLSYISPQAVERIDVLAGITPVSKGGDSIGGTIEVASPSPIFAAAGQGYTYGGQLTAFYKSNANNLGTAAAVHAADDSYSLGATGSYAHAGDYRSGSGAIVNSTSYETRDYSVTAAARGDAGQLTLRGGQQFVPFQAFPNQPMDMMNNHQSFLNGRYDGDFAWGKLNLTTFWNRVTHRMDDVTADKLVTWMPMPMLTESTEVGYIAKAEIPLSTRDTIRIGNELHIQRLKDWWPATSSTLSMMGPNDFININDGKRDRIGTHAEWEAKWTPQWTTLAGVRNDTVLMNAGAVEGYNTTTGGMAGAYQAEASAFNALNHHKTDFNFDATLLARFEADAMTTLEGGVARKTRSPSLYERYTWSSSPMTAAMVGWFGDGNAYVGNVGLKPEAAHTVSVSAGLHDDARQDWEIKLTPYATYVVDYINVDYVKKDTYPNRGAGNANNNASVLRFANHDAQLYGADLAARKIVLKDERLGKVGVGLVAGFVKGWQVNSGGGLYHMMPINGKLTIDHSLGGWSSALEIQGVDGKDTTDPLRRELRTPGYALVNLRGAYDWGWARLDAGIDNLFDKQYYSPMGGVSLGDWFNSNTYSSGYAPLAGMGRSFNAAVTVRF